MDDKLSLIYMSDFNTVMHWMHFTAKGQTNGYCKTGICHVCVILACVASAEISRELHTRDNSTHFRDSEAYFSFLYDKRFNSYEFSKF